MGVTPEARTASHITNGDSMSSYDQSYNECCGSWTDPLGECKCKGERRVARDKEAAKERWLAAERLRQKYREETGEW